MKEYYKIITHYGLEHYLKDVLTESNSNSAPYHNIYHVMCMVKNVVMLGESESLSDYKIKNLVISVLFHDFNHSQGKFSDDVNVEIALASFLRFSKESDEDNLEIIENIRATEYPYAISDNVLTQSQKIIRDCDMMQAFEDNYIQQLVFGLGVGEMGRTLDETVSGLYAFTKNMEMYTVLGKQLLNNNVNLILTELYFLKTLINR
jgi:hypothetical protein